MSRRSSAGFFSSAGSFFLPVGGQIERQPHGYYLDLTVKAPTTEYPAKWKHRPDRHLHVWTIQWGLGCYERYLSGEGDRWLAAAIGIGSRLVTEQIDGGRLEGAWPHTRPFPHTYALRPPWLSAMAQGQGASLLVRLFRATGDPDFRDAAIRALRPLGVPAGEGGVLTELDGHPFFEEYPTQPASYVLNGAIFTIWGVYDVAVGLDHPAERQRLIHSMQMLRKCLHLWDTGSWSRYDLFPHPTVNVASSFYHSLHINQLRAMQLVEPDPVTAAVLTRFERYAATPTCRRRAMVRKGLFRMLVPRNRLLALRTPWSRSRAPAAGTRPSSGAEGPGRA